MSGVMAYSAMPNFTLESKKENKLDVHKCNFLKKALVLKNVIILNYIFFHFKRIIWICSDYYILELSNYVPVSQIIQLRTRTNLISLVFEFKIPVIDHR